MREKAYSIAPSPGLFPEAQSREINLGKGQWKLPVSRNNHIITVLFYRYNTFMPVYLHLLSLIFINMSISNVTVLCQDYAIVRHLAMKNFIVSWTKLLWLRMK